MALRAPDNPIFCALDTTDLGRATEWTAAVASGGSGIKIGYELFDAHGPDGVRRLTTDGDPPLFLDLKLHDIPNTVAAAVRAVSGLSPFFLTVHATGGPAMMQAARNAAASAGDNRPRIIAVTVLTSLDDEDLAAVGIEGPTTERAVELAKLAQTCGLDGVVCSPLEIKAIRAACGVGFALVVPGIRPVGAERGDQKRTMTPAEAMALGADYLVIGRPITQSENPSAAASDIAAELAA